MHDSVMKALKSSVLAACYLIVVVRTASAEEKSCVGDVGTGGDRYNAESRHSRSRYASGSRSTEHRPIS